MTARATATHVLVVDDAVDLALLFQTVLEAEGYRVSVAHDGVAALELDGSDPADAVVTDLSMPRMVGTELLERLRERRPLLPGVIVTGYADRVGPAARLTGVLIKPVAIGTLLSTLAGLIEDAACLRELGR